MNLTEGDSEPHEVDAIGGRHHEPIDRACVLDVLIPTSASEHLELAARRPGRICERCRRIGLEPVQAPLPNVAMHVVYSPWIRTFQSDGMRRRFAVFSRPGELIGHAGIVTKTEEVGGSGPTRVFP